MKLAIWDITSGCNLRCSHCYNADKYFNTKVNDLDTTGAYKLISLLKENDYDRLHILGGEPLLRKDLFEIIQFSKSKGLEASLTTNGLLLDERMRSRLINHAPLSIYISVESGIDEINDKIRGEGTLKKVKENMIAFRSEIESKNADIKILLSTTVSGSNVATAPSILEFCETTKVDTLCVGIIMNAGNAASDWNLNQLANFEYFDGIESIIRSAEERKSKFMIQVDARPAVIDYLQKKYATNVVYTVCYTDCLFMQGSLYIQADGTVHPCGIHALDAGIKSQELGHYNAEDAMTFDKFDNLNEVYNSKYFVEFTDSMMKLKKDEYHKNCKSCRHIQYCYPCPYQFEEGVVDCDWAEMKLNEYYGELGSRIVQDVKVLDSNLLIAKPLYKHLPTITEGQTILENYSGSLEKHNLEFESYLNVIKEYEKRFLLRTL